MNAPSRRRRTGLAGLLAGAALLLGACATPAAPPAPAVDPRAEALHALGFRISDAGWEFSLAGKLLFDTGSALLDAQSQATADRLGRELAILGVPLVRIEGHTDSVGSADYNAALSVRRARAVAQALAQAGLQDATLEVRGLGQAHPVSANDTPERRQQNRRVAVIVPAL